MADLAVIPGTTVPIMPVAFGCEISEDRCHAAIVAAGRGQGGRILVDVSPLMIIRAARWPRMIDLDRQYQPVAVVVDPRSQAATMIKPLTDAGVAVIQPTTLDVVIAHGQFIDLVNDVALEHLDQPVLTSAVRAALQRPLSGANAWDHRVMVDQAPLLGATLAIWAFTGWEAASSPGAWVL